MQDTDITTSLQQRGALREEAATPPPRMGGMQAHKAASGGAVLKPRGLLQRMAAFCAWLFTGKWRAVAAQPAAETTAAPQAVAFKGDTASTLVTPMGAYAGKPAQAAIRRRAEQQFKNMDITTATMN